jgi:glycosyltransferase involved in cell wall biosynthesis
VARRLREIPLRILTLARLFRNEKFDIVQNVMFTAGLVGTFFAAYYRVPVIINSIRSLGFVHRWYRRPLKRLIYSMSDSVVANSNEIKHNLVRHRITNGINVETIYNGVDTKRFRPAGPDGGKLAADAEIRRGFSPVVVVVANLTSVKNHVSLLNAIPQILREFPMTAFQLIGSGPLKSSLEQMAQALGIQQNVFFWAQEETPKPC